MFSTQEYSINVHQFAILLFVVLELPSLNSHVIHTFVAQQLDELGMGTCIKPAVLLMTEICVSFPAFALGDDAQFN